MPLSGAQQMRLIGRRLQAAGDGKVLRRQLSRDIRIAAQPLVNEVKEAARYQLPHTGGLNQRIAQQPVSVLTAVGPRTAGVRLRHRSRDAVRLDEGYIRHPVFARADRTRNQWTWVSQQVPAAAGWWSATLRRRAYTVTPAVLAAMQRVSDELTAI